MKLISDSYLYQKADYNKEIFNYLMSAERVDKNADSFSDIVYDVKRQANASLLKVLLSDKVVLTIDPKGVSRAFKVIYAKDVKDKKQNKKVFIDCSGVIGYDNGIYTCKKPGNLVSYLVTAMIYVIYYNLPKAILTNHVIMKSGTEAFVDLMLYVLSYLKVPVTFADNKERMAFVLAEYFQLCVAGRDNGDIVYNLSKSVSNIKEKKTCDYYHALLSRKFEEDGYTFDKFLSDFSKLFLDQDDDKPTPKNRAKLTVDSFAQRWMYAYGPSTFLGLEVFVPFSQILTDCAVGAFLNQQNTIEKVVGSKNVAIFFNEIMKIGSENV